MHTSSGKKLIVFALWGPRPIYNIGAVKNFHLAQRYYPGWTCRFYVAWDSPALPALEALPCEVLRMQPPFGEGWMAAFWRLLPVNEYGVERCIFRDCDSRLNDAEAQAVRAWEASGRGFHTMRGMVHHQTVPMAAGMCGARAGAIPDPHEKLWHWMRHYWNPHWRKEDLAAERFLTDMVWPQALQDILIHGFGGVSYPRHEPIECGQFIGQQIDEFDVPLHTVPAHEVYPYHDPDRDS